MPNERVYVFCMQDCVSVADNSTVSYNVIFSYFESLLFVIR